MSSKTLQEDFPVHWLVWDNDYRGLERELSNNKSNVNITPSSNACSTVRRKEIIIIWLRLMKLSQEWVLEILSLKKSIIVVCNLLGNDHGEMQKHCKVICRECLPSPHIHICPSAFGSVLPKWQFVLCSLKIAMSDSFRKNSTI